MAGKNLSVRLTNGEVVDVKLHKVKATGVQKPVVVERDQDGEIIFKKRRTDTGVVFDKFQWIKVNANGEEYKPKKINKFQVLEDGSEELIKFPEATKRVTFSFGSVLPATYVGRLLPIAQYELVATEAEGIEALYYEMERLIEKGDLAFYTSPFIWKKGSTEQYISIFQPYIHEDRFGWLMFTSQGKITYEHTMKVESGEETEAKTLQTLTPLTELLGIEAK